MALAAWEARESSLVQRKSAGAPTRRAIRQGQATTPARRRRQGTIMTADQLSDCTHDTVPRYCTTSWAPLLPRWPPGRVPGSQLAATAEPRPFYRRPAQRCRADEDMQRSAAAAAASGSRGGGVAHRRRGAPCATGPVAETRRGRWAAGKAWRRRRTATKTWTCSLKRCGQKQGGSPAEAPLPLAAKQQAFACTSCIRVIPSGRSYSHTCMCYTAAGFCWPTAAPLTQPPPPPPSHPPTCHAGPGRPRVCN